MPFWKRRSDTPEEASIAELQRVYKARVTGNIGSTEYDAAVARVIAGGDASLRFGPNTHVVAAFFAEVADLSVGALKSIPASPKDDKSWDWAMKELVGAAPTPSTRFVALYAAIDALRLIWLERFIEPDGRPRPDVAELMTHTRMDQALDSIRTAAWALTVADLIGNDALNALYRPLEQVIPRSRLGE